MTRGERVIAFIERFCKAPEGEHVGKPLKLEPFQVAFIRKVYDNPAGTRRGILTIGRKNGKTALIAGILLAHSADRKPYSTLRSCRGLCHATKPRWCSHWPAR